MAGHAPNESSRPDRADRQDGRRTRAGDPPHRRPGRAVSGLRACPGPSVGSGGQLGRRRSRESLAPRRRRRDPLSKALLPLRPADGEQGRRRPRPNPVQPARQGPQPQLGPARRPRARPRKPRPRNLAQGDDQEGPATRPRPGAAQRRQRSGPRQSTAAARRWEVPRPHEALRGPASQTHLVHRRSQAPSRQRRHPQRRLAGTLRHRRRGPRAQLSVDRRPEGTSDTPAMAGATAKTWLLVLDRYFSGREADAIALRGFTRRAFARSPGTRGSGRLASRRTWRRADRRGRNRLPRSWRRAGPRRASRLFGSPRET